MKEFEGLTKYNVIFGIIWNTRKMQFLFNLLIKNEN